MAANVSIDIDRHTADVLQARAAELGVTVPQLVAELAALDSTSRDADADEIAELDRRAAAATPSSRVPQERVVQWLRTWGTPGFRPWQGLRLPAQPVSSRPRALKGVNGIDKNSGGDLPDPQPFWWPPLRLR